VKFYEYGIDLGTTNSCIAKLSDSDVVVFQNQDNMNVTPSAVYIHKSGRMLVGRRASDKVLETGGEVNTAFNFKRLLGVKHTYKFKDSKKEMTPIQLSAELLKSMKEDVKRLTDTKVTHAVITVPAAFGTIQCEDTYKAAELAGFANVELLQEPIAAAIAYGAKPGADDQYWMVFDYGGGTLDIAIISTHDGRLTVINHEGDNYFGGKDIDNLIYEHIILPKVKNKYNLLPQPKSFVSTRLNRLAEDAKKRLSTNETIELDIFDVGEDNDGNPIECRIEITRDEFELIIQDIMDKAVKMAEKAVAESKIKEDALSKILLVGGSTLIPLLKQSLINNFSAEIDNSIDPMTVVARGAAIYASTYRVPQDKEIENINENDGEMTVQLEYSPVTSENTVNIVGRLNNLAHLKPLEFRIDEKSGIWTSGWIELLDPDQGILDADVSLQSNTLNSFKISVRDDKGNLITLKDDSFQVKHQDSALITSSPPMPHSLCVEVDENEERFLEPLLKKGTSLPAKGIRKFKASKTVKPKSDDFIAIKIWEGEKFDYPDANLWVGNAKIKGADIERPIPEGFEIEISVSIDESRKIKVDTYIPLLDIFMTEHLVYSVEPVDLKVPMEQMGDEIKEAYKTLNEIQERDIDYGKIYDESEALLTELHEIDMEYLNCVELVGDDDDRIMQLLKKFNDFKAKVFHLEKIEQKDNMERDASEEIQKIEDAIYELGSEDDQQEFEKLKEGYQHSLSEEGNRGKEHHREKMEDLRYRVFFNHPGVLEYFYEDLCKPDIAYKDEKQASHWKEKGRQAINLDDVAGLREAVINLIWLSDRDEVSMLNEKNLPPGLRR